MIRHTAPNNGDSNDVRLILMKHVLRRQCKASLRPRSVRGRGRRYGKFAYTKASLRWHKVLDSYVCVETSLSSVVSGYAEGFRKLRRRLWVVLEGNVRLESADVAGRYATIEWTEC